MRTLHTAVTFFHFLALRVSVSCSSTARWERTNCAAWLVHIYCINLLFIFSKTAFSIESCLREVRRSVTMSLVDRPLISVCLGDAEAQRRITEILDAVCVLRCTTNHDGMQANMREFLLSRCKQLLAPLRELLDAFPSWG